MSLEQTFLDRIAAEPENALHRLIYADWLEEQGDPRGELLRIQEQLRTLDVPGRPKVEARMHELLNQGVQPLTITRTNTLGMKLVLIFPGQFLMGIPPDENDRRDDEGSVEVTLTRAFWLGQFVVTQSEWVAVMGSTPWRGGVFVIDGFNYPATYVGWGEAVEFCQKLTTQEQLSSGQVYILPTEAQWEYACRAGTQSLLSFVEEWERLGEWEYAWFENNADSAGEQYAHEVGKKKPNPWSLYDLLGNVWEWCRDSFRNRQSGGTDPDVHEQAANRVFRGGSWYDKRRYCQPACRVSGDPSDRADDLGFRVALVQTQ